MACSDTEASANPVKGRNAKGQHYIINIVNLVMLKGSEMAPKLPNLTQIAFYSIISVSDRLSLLYKVYQGRKDIRHKVKIPESTDIWAVVNYMRTLK